MLKRIRDMMRKPAFYQVGGALMICGITVAYLNIRFADIRSLQEVSSLIEISGALFLLSLACIAISYKCSLDLKRVSSSAVNAQDTLRDTESQHTVLVELTQNSHLAEGELSAAAREVTEALSGTLAAERASVWLLNEDATEITCLDLYRRSVKNHSTSDPIRSSNYPNYFRSLNHARIIDVPDALRDRRTREICKDYLTPWNIHSTIDSSIRVSGKVVGYVFVGSVGEKRDWSAPEINFVAAVADQFAQAIVNNEKRRTFDSLHRVMLTTSVATGDEFFELLVCQLCSALNVRYAMVTRWSDCAENRMKSIALADEGEIIAPLEYLLDNTPCADVIKHGFLYIPEKLQQLYPRDDIAAGMALESYMGAPMLDSAGNKIGILNVFHTGQIPQSKMAKKLLEVFAARAAIELGRIETLKELNGSKALLDATLDSTADGLLVVDKNGVVKMTNRRFEEFWGIPRELIEIGDDDKFLAHVLDQLADPRLFLKKVRELYDSDREDFDVVLFKDGRMFERYSCPLRLDGSTAGRVWSFRDITVKERAVASLLESEDRYHGIFDCTTDSLIIFDADGNIVEVNRAACKLHGLTEEEFRRLSPEDIMHRDSLPLYREFMETLAAGQSFQCVAKDLHKDGSIIDVEVNGAPITIGGVTHYLCVERDITERKRRERRNREMQEKLERAERMQSIGVLAGGVAHDLNNILGPLVAYPELILMKLPQDSPLRERIELIGKSAKHAADVIQDLLTLSRRGRVELQPISVNKIVTDVLRSTNFVQLERENPRVNVTVKLDSELAAVNASKAYLTKALLNLCANAFTAMPEGGELTIETTQVYLERLYSGYSAMQPGNYVGLKISDTGEGMTEEHLNKLFEPYYNKKNVASSASGLGLAIVYGVIKDHGGYYDVTSEPAQGTEFIVYLPAISEQIQAEYLKPSSHRGSETVLIVDDDESQRILASALLESLGYDVASAPDGRSAVEALETRHADVVVLDMIMEDGFDGLDTYREILKRNPHQKAVIVTGFAATERVDEMHRLGASVYVKKPYTRDAIGKAVRETLDKVTSPTALKA